MKRSFIVITLSLLHEVTAPQRLLPSFVGCFCLRFGGSGE